MPCISFSEVPLPRLLARRRFQPHLQRWDWEPYGLLVQRHVLASAGARPVIYGDDGDYAALDDEGKPFFQPALRKSAATDESHWFQEREWRLLGDLVLGRLACDSVYVFVRTETEAKGMARQSPWPVFWIES